MPHGLRGQERATFWTESKKKLRCLIDRRLSFLLRK